MRVFSEMLKLVRVIVGARCTLSPADIDQVIDLRAKSFTLLKARAGFTKFEIVKDKRGFKG